IVNERDQAILAVQRYEARYRALVTHIPAVTWTADADGNAIFVSPNVAHITGFTTEELMPGRWDRWLAQVQPHDVSPVREGHEALKVNCTPYDMDYRLKHRNGHWIWIRDCAMCAYEQDGVAHFAGVLIDITTRKQAELELERQRQLLIHLTRVATLGELSG